MYIEIAMLVLQRLYIVIMRGYGGIVTLAIAYVGTLVHWGCDSTLPGVCKLLSSLHVEHIQCYSGRISQIPQLGCSKVL